jgi:hypothetical protein
MARGGVRPNSGRPKGKKSYAGKSESRRVIEARIRELLRRGHETAKQEAARLAVQLLPYDEPRLNAVTAQTEVTHTYVARIPSQILDITEWQEVAKKTLLLDSK